MDFLCASVEVENVQMNVRMLWPMGGLVRMGVD